MAMLAGLIPAIATAVGAAGTIASSVMAYKKGKDLENKQAGLQKERTGLMSDLGLKGAETKGSYSGINSLGNPELFTPNVANQGLQSGSTSLAQSPRRSFTGLPTGMGGGM